MQKGWTLTYFVLYFFSIFIIFMLKITPILLLFVPGNVWTHGSAVFAKVLACAERKLHKQKLLLLWDNKLLKKYLDACIRHNFWNIKNTALYIFVDDKSFRHLSVVPLTFLFHPKVFPQKNTCKGRIQFWEVCWKRFARDAKFSRSVEKRYWQLFFKLNFPLTRNFIPDA